MQKKRKKKETRKKKMDGKRVAFITKTKGRKYYRAIAAELSRAWGENIELKPETCVYCLEIAYNRLYGGYDYGYVTDDELISKSKGFLKHM